MPTMDPTKSCAQSTSSAMKFSTATPFSLTGIFSALENQIIRMTPILINKKLAKPKKHRPNDPAYDVEGQREAGHLEKYHFVAKIGLFNLNMHYIIENHRILVFLTKFDLMATDPKIKTIATLFVRAVMGRLHTGQESRDRPAAKTFKTKKTKEASLDFPVNNDCGGRTDNHQSPHRGTQLTSCWGRR